MNQLVELEIRQQLVACCEQFKIEVNYEHLFEKQVLKVEALFRWRPKEANTLSS